MSRIFFSLKGLWSTMHVSQLLVVFDSFPSLVTLAADWGAGVILARISKSFKASFLSRVDFLLLGPVIRIHVELSFDGKSLPVTPGCIL